MGRALSLTYPVLKNRFLRLTRNYLNLIDTALSGFSLPEDIAFDGFESYVRSQYFPCNFNIAVGCRSQVPYLFNLTLMRRKGVMTDIQKTHRSLIDDVWHPKKRALIESSKEAFREIFSLYLNRSPLTPFTIHTDEKKEYVVALKELPEARHLAELGLFHHQTISSRAERTLGNSLFPVNYIDREIRKNSASHVRETVRGDREANMAVSRMLLILGHHIFRKPFRINNIKDIELLETHGDKVQLLESAEAKRAFERLYTHRHLWSHQKMQTKWSESIWLMKEENPPIVDLVSGAVKEKGQPGTAWTARHLVA